MSSSSRHLLTAPAWPYANGPRHIGRVSGFAPPTGMLSRHRRMAGDRTLIAGGTDEPARLEEGKLEEGKGEAQ